MARKKSALEDEDTWDLEGAERQRPARSARVVVSVPFGISEYDVVAGAAEALGTPTSRFIREAAVSRASSAGAVTSIEFLGWTTEDRMPRLYGGRLPVIETISRREQITSVTSKEPLPSVSGKAR
jgi:hypothetical protein